MTELPKIGDILIVLHPLHTGKQDFTWEKAIQVGTLCVVIGSDYPLMRERYAAWAISREKGQQEDAKVILTLLFPDGVVEWELGWASWKAYLGISNVGES
jgi:hypothetical protein